MKAAEDAGVKLSRDVPDVLAFEDEFDRVLGQGSMSLVGIGGLFVNRVSFPTDTLAHLPPELVWEIFAFAARATKPFSRTFLPYTQRNLYREVTIKSSRDLAGFAETCVRRPALGALVTTLVVDFSDEVPQGGGAPSDEQLIGLFRTLVAVTNLQIINSSRFADVLSLTVAYRFLPSLKDLALADAFVAPTRPRFMYRTRGGGAHPAVSELLELCGPTLESLEFGDKTQHRYPLPHDLPELFSELEAPCLCRLTLLESVEREEDLPEALPEFLPPEFLPRCTALEVLQLASPVLLQVFVPVLPPSTIGVDLRFGDAWNRVGARARGRRVGRG